MKNIAPIATQQFLEKADHFFQGMRLLSDDIPAYRTGISLLAIHTAISLTDAIGIGLTGKKKRYQDHMQAARDLGKYCTSQRISSMNGINHLRWLLDQKNAAAYDSRRLDDESVRLAIDKAERYYSWAYTNFKEILGAKNNP